MLTPAGNEGVSHTGIWLLKTEDAQHGGFEQQIHALLSDLSEDFSIWTDFSERYRGRIFVGLFLSGFHEGLSISPQTLIAIGVRGLALDLDIYSGEDEADAGEFESGG